MLGRPKKEVTLVSEMKPLMPCAMIISSID